MQNITIVCGAGVSSTFLSHRIGAAAVARGLTLAVTASSLAGLGPQAAGDVILLGPHLAAEADAIVTQHPEVRVAVVTEAILRALDGDAALELALGTDQAAATHHADFDSSTATNARSTTHG